jgi:hypothetical protein
MSVVRRRHPPVFLFQPGARQVGKWRVCEVTPTVPWMGFPPVATGHLIREGATCDVIPPDGFVRRVGAQSQGAVLSLRRLMADVHEVPGPHSVEPGRTSAMSVRDNRAHPAALFIEGVAGA